MKTPLLLAISIVLFSCRSIATPKTAAFFTPVPTAFFTTSPTMTPPTPTRIPVTVTATAEPTPFTLFDKLFILGVTSTGNSIYGNLDGLFHIFTLQPSEFVSFRFTMRITAFHFIKSALTPTPTAIPTENWRILIYRYKTDGIYLNQPVVVSNFKTEVIPYDNRLLMSMTADVNTEIMQAKFGDCSAFIYQVIDDKGNIQQQGNFSFNPHLLFSYGGGLIGNVNDGITLGYPYSLNEKEKEFFHQGQFVTINEPKSSFYRLSYIFNLTEASGVYGTLAQEKLAGELTMRLFSHRSDGIYLSQDSYPATGTYIQSTGYYEVYLPLDYLKKNFSPSNKYYLQIVDASGKIIREDYFLFIPHVP